MEKNILLITIDCLRPDHLQCYGYKKEISPTIDKIASSGIVYHNAFSHGGGTPEAFPSLFTSTLPPIFSSEYNKIMKRNVTIAEYLKNEGYNTAAFHSNPYLSEYYGYDKGFNEFHDIPMQDNMGNKTTLEKLTNNNIIKIIKWEPTIARAKETTDKAISWLNKNAEDKIFLWIHYMDLHRPLMPPKEYIKNYSDNKFNFYKILKLLRKTQKYERLSDHDYKMVIDLYDVSIKYIDDEIKRLINNIDDSKTLIILTADHGELLGEHGIYDHGEVYDEVIRVPLIIKDPDVQQSIKNEEIITHSDINPIILNSIGKKKYNDVFNANILKTFIGNENNRKIVSVAINNKTNIRKISIRNKRYKYIITDDIKTNAVIKQELYEIDKDPKERSNIYSDQNEILIEYKNELKNFYKLKIKS